MSNSFGPMNCSTPGFPVLHYLPEFAQTHVIESVMPLNHLILCHPLSSCPQSFPASGCFPKSRIFASGGASASSSVLLMNIQDWFPLGWTGFISLQSKGLSRIFSSAPVQKRQFFSSGGQNIGVSASASVLPMNIQYWFPLGWTGWISLQSKGTLKSLLQHHSSKASILQCSAFLIVQLSHPYMTTGKAIAWTRRAFVGKVILCFLIYCLGLS